jgi:hypothetical protein
MSRANRRCACGSGKKTRSCCGSRDSEATRAAAPYRWARVEADGVGILVSDGTRANVVSVAGIQIWRPTEVAELRFREELSGYVREKYGRVVLTEPDRIVPALLDVYGYCHARRDEELDRIGSQQAAEFFVHLYAQWTEALARHRAGKTSGDEADLCDRRGSAARRSIELVLERLVLQAPGEDPKCSKSELVAHTDRVMIAGEWMIELALLVIQTRDLHPGNTVLELDPDSRGDFFILRVVGDVSTPFEEYRRVSQSGRSGLQYEDLLSPDNMIEMIDYFQPSFEADHGVSLRDTLGVVGALRSWCKERVDGGFPVVFVHEEGAVNAVAANAKRSVDVINSILAGITLRAEDLQQEPHEAWQPKKTRRVLRRPILSLPHSTGPHLCWSHRVLRHAMETVLQDISFGRLPPEWDGPNVRKALVQYLDRVRNQWESVVANALARRGMSVAEGLHTIRGKENRKVTIAPGEIDVLAVDIQRARVIVVEAKRLQPTYSPPEFAGELAQFRKDEYVDKVLRKVDWVRDHWDDVRAHLVRWCGMKDAPEVPVDFRGCLVTKYESYAQVIDRRLPILSAARMCRVFDETGSWLFLQ